MRDGGRAAENLEDNNERISAVCVRRRRVLYRSTPSGSHRVCARQCVAGGKGRELVTMFVDWMLRSSKKYESQKTVSQFNLFF